jgi:hypothetical protein
VPAALVAVAVKV